VIQLNLKKLVDKLSTQCRRSLEGAAGLCLSRTNYNVEIEHWLAKLLETPGLDIHAILSNFEIDAARLKSELTRAIDRFKTGNAKPPSLSPEIVEWVRAALLFATVDCDSPRVRSGHLLYAILATESLSRSVLSSLPSLEKISVEMLKRDLSTITADTEEARELMVGGAVGGALQAAGAAPNAAGGRTPSLDQFTIDLTKRARDGKIDPVLGRDNEIRQMIDILTRRRQNNPILTGEAGVGKTAVVEGFALRIASGDVPLSIKDVSVRTLDLGLLQAGAGVKGEFENRLKSVIEEVKASPKPIILFIDEAHTMIGAGGSAGQGDAANLLKPALARGELRTIAATTWAEYKKYFEKDAALARRFQVVKIEEPAESVAIDMIRGLTATLEKHHGVRILNDAIIDAVKLSNRYISGRQLPDKAVSLIDTTCARIGLSQSTTPPAVEDAMRRLDQLKVTTGILEREELTGTDHGQRIAELDVEYAGVESELAAMKLQWEQEKILVKEIHKLSMSLEATADPPVETLTPEQRTELKVQLKAKESELRTLQGERPLVHPSVDKQAVAETVAAWTGIPIGRMVADEIQTVLQLKEHMEKSIIGQSHALDRIAQSIRTSRAQLSDPRAPIGVFLLAGTSGVGKTETAITLAELLYGGEQNMTVINMSEFKEEHKVSLLMGSPPGYVGYGEGGVLTEAVRRKPYSVILLDEMEKAHPGVQDIFYQVFDKGQMKDGEGRDIDFKNTVILMTSNAGSDLIKSLCSDPDTAPEPDAFIKALFPELLKTFKPAFLGRVSIIPYYPLSDEVLKRIVRLKLAKIGNRFRENYNARFEYSPDLVDLIASRCTEVDTGARNVDHILTRSLLPDLSAEVLSRMAQGTSIGHVKVSSNESGGFVYDIS